jgi:natural product precursor
MKKIRLIELSKNDLKKITGGDAPKTCSCSCGDSDTTSSQVRSNNSGTVTSI